MIIREYSSIKRVFACILIIALCISLNPDWKNQEEAEAATVYKFTSSLIWGDGDVSAKFRITRNGYNLTGLCRHGGPPNSAAASAVMKELKRTDTRFYLAYYYGKVKGWTSGAKGCDLARAFNYATYGNAYHQSASRSKSMISKAKAYVNEHGVPENFVAYDCDPTNGTQEFIAWYYVPSGYLKLTKKSADENTVRTGKYSFKNIQYKVYASENTNSRCYGTFDCSKGGSSEKIKLPPDGFEARTYYVKETKTNDYFKMSSKWYRVSVSPGRTKTLTVKDEPKLGTLRFTKVLTADSSAEGSCEGFRFTLTNKNDSKLKYSGVSDKNGNVIISDILIGTYVLKEELTASQLEKGYKAVSKEITVTIKAGSNTLGTESNCFENKMLTDKPRLIISKTTDDNGPVEGWKFTVKNTVTGETRTGTTDSFGEIRYDKLPAGTYEIIENMSDEQCIRYRQPAKQTVTIADADTECVAVEFVNRGRSEPLKIKKISEDGIIEGIEFELTGIKYYGTEQQEKIDTVTGTTDENGILDFGELVPGHYVIEETGFSAANYFNRYPLDGYDNPARRINVTSEGIEVDGNPVKDGEIEFENIPFSIRLEKTEILADGTKTDNPVEGAEYELYKVIDGEEAFVGTYVTDMYGRAEVYNVGPGDYRFYETSVPAGYMESVEAVAGTGDENDETVLMKPAAVECTISPHGEGKVVVKDSNRQKYGSVFIKKLDKDDNPVEDAEFTLFSDEACTMAANNKDGNELVKKSDERGYVLFENLEWNTYYLKETKAPRGFNASSDVRKLVIGYDREQESIVTDYEIHVINEHKPGSVELSKVNQDGHIIAAQAVYDLYRNDGTMVKAGLKTGEDNDGDGVPDGTGVIKVSNLEWGSYYFLEKQAPEGYMLSDEKIRFTVNAFTGGTVQKLTAEDKITTTYVVVSKKIIADDIHFEHGVPTFTFNLKGKDIDGTEREYNRNVTFSEDYVKKYTEADGYVCLSATFSDIPAGIYTLTEDTVLRYKLKEIEPESLINGVIKGNCVEFNLNEGNLFGTATFINEKNDWNDYSDTTAVANIVRKQKMYTVLTAEYNGQILDGNMPITDFSDYCDVVAVYDDGSEMAIGESEYTVTDVDGNVFERTPKVQGNYMLTVTHTENGITHTALVEIQVAAAKKVTVNFDVNGGSPLESMQVWKYDTLAESTNNPSLYTTAREYYKFAGWFADCEFTERINTDSTKITEDMTIHAMWEMKHLNDYSWDEIAELSEDGKAEAVLGECFEMVKQDIADGRLSSYDHTKTFIYGGKTVHAMITGFGSDVDIAGNTVGVSFMTYESAGNAAMNTIDTNIGGWKESELRDSLNSGIDADIIDTQLKSNLKEIKKLSAVKTDSGDLSIAATYDKLAIPSQIELAGVFGFDKNYLSVTDTEYGVLRSLEGEGNMYPLFQGIVPDSSVNSESALGRGYTYWTRSIAADTCGFCTVLPNGAFSFTGN